MERSDRVTIKSPQQKPLKQSALYKAIIRQSVQDHRRHGIRTSIGCGAVLEASSLSFLIGEGIRGGFGQDITV